MRIMRLPKDVIKRFNRLIYEISLRNSKALEEFYKIYGRLIYTSAFSITKSEFLANEIVDDVLWKIWTNAKNIKKIKNDRGFVYTVTMNCAKDKLRSEEQTAISQEERGDPFEDFLDREEFFYDISCLSEAEQQIVIFRIVEDMSFKEIAKTLKMPLSTLTSIYYRSLEKIEKSKKFT